MIILLTAILYLLLFAVGAAVGSFLNVLVYRLPRKLSFVRGFSFCPACGHRLYPRDLVPIFSYLLLGRSCRYCKAAISCRYLLTESVTGFLALLCYIILPLPVAVLAFLAGAVLLTITLIDTETMEIPDGLNLVLFLLGIAAIWLWPEVSLLSRIIGFFVVSLPLLLMALLIEGAFGGGDVKLMAAAGFLVGWQNALLAFVIGILLGGIYGICALIRRKKGRKDHFAFGPCLSVGIYISLFAGTPVVRWYLSFF
jgi:leader peptidase (prepilin peptidase)/N-methyltransferase